MICKSDIDEKEIPYDNIAYPELQDRRSLTAVDVEPYGHLHDYVPFYFAPRSPMLYVNYKKGDEIQKGIIYLISSAQSIKKSEIPFVFTDGHAIMALSHFYRREEDLENIDWNVMRGKYWYDTDEDNDRKRRRQAEFLIHRFMPWVLFEAIIVYDQSVKERVEKFIRTAAHKPTVHIKRNWYF